MRKINILLADDHHIVRMGLRTVMVTGDNPLTAKAIAEQAGVDDFIAQATPEAKLGYIRKERLKPDHPAVKSGRLKPATPAASAAADGARCSAAQLRGRALHAVLGHALGDAAACSVQWVYSEAALQTLAQGGCVVSGVPGCRSGIRPAWA